MKLILIIASLFCLAIASPSWSQSNANCAPRENVVERLAERYGESRQAVGLGGNNTMMELFASEETGSWTITVTMANGVTCLVAAGKSYELVGEDLMPTGQRI